MNNFTIDNDFKSFDKLIEKLKGYKRGDKLYYCRFGDGCIFMMHPQDRGQIVGGANKMYVSNELAKELSEAYNIQDENYMVGGTFDSNSQHMNGCIIPSHLMEDLIKEKIVIERDHFYSSVTFESNFLERPVALPLLSAPSGKAFTALLLSVPSSFTALSNIHFCDNFLWLSSKFWLANILSGSTPISAAIAFNTPNKGPVGITAFSDFDCLPVFGFSTLGSNSFSTNNFFIFYKY